MKARHKAVVVEHTLKAGTNINVLFFAYYLEFLLNEPRIPNKVKISIQQETKAYIAPNNRYNKLWLKTYKYYMGHTWSLLTCHKFNFWILIQ